MAFDLLKWFRGPSQPERLAAKGVRASVVTAAGRMATDGRSDNTLVELDKLLPADETVLVMMEGRLGKHLGLAVLTDKQVLFAGHQYEGGFLGQIPLAGLSRIEQPKPGRVQFVSDDVVMFVDRTLGTSAEQFADAVRRQQAGEEAVLRGDRDPLELLAELRALRDAGAMTAEQFETEKAKLIADL